MAAFDVELARVFERAPIGMYRSREDGTILHANSALARMLGCAGVEEVLGLNLDRDVYLYGELRRPMIAKYLAASKPDTIRVRWKHRAGHELMVQLWGRVVADSPTEYEVWVLDVTSAEESTRNLRQTVTTLDYVLRLVPGIYWRTDRDQRIVEVGGATQEVLGFSGAAKHVGLTISEQQALELDGSTQHVERHARALAGEVLTFDSEYRDKMLSLTLGPQRDPDGKVSGAIGVAIDVTRARQLERKMIDTQRAESLGVLAGGLAHDFNNLLVAVIGSAELALRELPSGTTARAAVDNIRTAGLRAAELTQQLLAYAGRGGRGVQMIYLAEVVDELVRIVAPTVPEHVRVSVDVPAVLALRGDPGQLRQVVLNLIANARDALGADGGHVAIEARACAHTGDAETDDNVVLAAPAGEYVKLVVRDDGPGFDRETRRHVFEPFFTTKPTGHGLGLAAVLGIVRAHGGGIRVVSEPGSGAAFEVLWPAARSARPSTPPPAGAMRTVLVVDDEDLVRDVVARMLEELGYAAITAADGAHALARLDDHEVDAVIVDLTMPDMSGAQVLAAVRARRPGMPVIVCSGYSRGGAGKVDADAYLPKPFRIDALERTLAKLLPLRSV